MSTCTPSDYGVHEVFMESSMSCETSTRSCFCSTVSSFGTNFEMKIQREH